MSIIYKIIIISNKQSYNNDYTNIKELLKENDNENYIIIVKVINNKFKIFVITEDFKMLSKIKNIYVNWEKIEMYKTKSFAQVKQSHIRGKILLNSENENEIEKINKKENNSNEYLPWEDE